MEGDTKIIITIDLPIVILDYISRIFDRKFKTYGDLFYSSDEIILIFTNNDEVKLLEEVKKYFPIKRWNKIMIKKWRFL